MTLIFTKVFTFFSNLFTSHFSDVSLRYIATKTLLYTFLTGTFPIVIKNLIVWLVEQTQQIVNSLSGGKIDSITIQLSGLAGYLGDHLMLSTCLSIILTAIILRMCLNFIPFAG